MKLSVYARKMGVRYETAWRWFKQGHLLGEQLPSGTIVLFAPAERREVAEPSGVAIYARVSAAENRPDLDRQAERLVAYSTAKGYQITQVVKEVGSGVNDSRPPISQTARGSNHSRDCGRTPRPGDPFWVPLSRDVARPARTTSGGREPCRGWTRGSRDGSRDHRVLI